MKKVFIICVLLFLGSVNTSQANHIVGGDFQYERLSGENFKITLKLFRDCWAANAAPFDPSVRVGVYHRSTNFLQQEFIMPLLSIGPLELSGQLCSPPPTVCVEQGVYSATVQIPDTTHGFDGYYLIWERCCRNAAVLNINNSSSTSMAFYLEMPDPILNNSSPQFLNDPLPYMCIGQPFSYNFNAFDTDGDSLVYSLNQPKAGGNFTSANPNGGGNFPTTPAPYADVAWQFPFSLSNLAGGVPVRIDAVTGDITATPNLQGIFAMAVKIREFRNGIEIGHIIREVQFNVIACLDNDEPSLTNNAVNAVYNLFPGDTLDIVVEATDPDTNDSLFLSVTGNNLPGNPLLPPYATAVNDSGVAYASIPVFWIPTCDHVSSTPYTMTFTALDNGCPQNLFEVGTIKINVGGFEQAQKIEIECAEVFEANRGILYINNLPKKQVPGMYYILYRSVNGGSFIFHDSINQLGNSLDYIDSIGVDFAFNEYCYFIQGYNFCELPGESSDSVCISGPVPANLYINQVTVLNNDHIELSWDMVSIADSQDVKIFRKDSRTNTGFYLYNTISDSSITVFKDHSTDINLYKYCYYLQQDLPCGKRQNKSNKSCNIILRGQSYPMQNYTNWTKYIGWENDVSDYEIYRSDYSVGSAYLVATVIGNEVVYLDTDLDYSIYEYEYYIVAKEFGTNKTSVSNKINLEQESVLYVPNAFSPNSDGKNDAWGVSFLFLHDFNVQIYNRFGLKVFESNNPNERWTGTFDGVEVPEGNYVYVLKYSGIIDRNVKTLKGNLVLLR